MTLEKDNTYMRRALQLAKNGRFDASPNPMVGAVIVADGKIIGEGFHRRCGEPHAEVNAVNSVSKPDLLRRATIYVTLEPCAHYGKTPPCAQLLIDKEIPRIVVGCQDPFAKVSGRGISMLRDAGREVVVGVLEEECLALNRRFIRAHSARRPYVMLKWAQSADGFIGAIDKEGRPLPVSFSNPATAMTTHRLRAEFDAIMVGTGTVIADNPRLDTRLWPGSNPRPVTMDFHGRIPHEAAILANPQTIIYREGESPASILSDLYSRHGITSLLVEGGARLLQSFIDEDLFDEIRVETAPVRFEKGIPAPQLKNRPLPSAIQTIRGNRLEHILR